MHNPLSLWSGGFQLKTSRIRTEWRRTKRQLSWTYGSDQLGWGHDQYYHESNAITSPFKVTVWAAHQFFQLILLSVWPRGPHFTMHSHIVFLPLMHRLFRQLGDNQSWNTKGRKAIRDALALLALRSQKSRTQRTLKHKKKKNVITICLGSTDYGTVIVRGTLRMLNAQLSPSAFLLCSNSPK